MSLVEEVMAKLIPMQTGRCMPAEDSRYDFAAPARIREESCPSAHVCMGWVEDALRDVLKEPLETVSQWRTINTFPNVYRSTHQWVQVKCAGYTLPINARWHRSFGLEAFWDEKGLQVLNVTHWAALPDFGD